MNKYNVILIVVTIVFCLSCKNNNIDLNSKTAKEEFKNIESVASYSDNSSETYEIHLTTDQVTQIENSRSITLTSEQSEILKNKINQFHVSGKRASLPDGWFLAIWSKPDTIEIQKYLIDDFDNIILDAEGFETDEEQVNINLNIDLKGRYHFNNSILNENDVINEIVTILKRTEAGNIAVYVSHAPYSEKNIENTVELSVNKIKKFCDEKQIHFQDDY